MTQKARAKILLAQLQEGKNLPTSYEIGTNTLIKRTSTAGNYTIILYGTYKEICLFLEGIQYLSMMQLPCNQTKE